MSEYEPPVDFEPSNPTDEHGLSRPNASGRVDVWWQDLNYNAEIIDSLLQTIPTSESDEINVADHGFPGDMSGGDIMQFLGEEDNATYVLPAGEYAVESSLMLENVPSMDSIRIVGEPHARLVVNSSDVFRFWSITDVSSVMLENLTLVIDGPNDMDTGIGRIWVDEFLKVENLGLEGARERHEEVGGNWEIKSNAGARLNFQPVVTDEDGIGILKNVRFLDGETPIPHNDDRVTACHTEGTHVGTLIWIGCIMSGFGGHGYYLRPSENGRNLMHGCSARNNGGTNLRPGAQDTIDGFESTWDDDKGGNARIGVCFDCDDGQGTTVNSLRAVHNIQGNDAVRVRSGTTGISMNNVTIESSTSNHTLRVSATPDPQEGLITFDGLSIIDTGSGSTIQAAAVQLRSPAVSISDSYIKTTQSNRVGVHITETGSNPTNIRFNGAIFDQNGAESIRIGDSSGGNTISSVSFDGGRWSHGLQIYDSSDNIQALNINNVDLRDVSGDIWTGIDPNGSVADIDNFSFISNPGFASLGTELWGGNAIVFNSDPTPDTDPYIRFVTE